MAQQDRPARAVLTVPNLLSGLRLLGVPVFLWLVLVPEADGWALALLVASGITDYLDGWLARRLGQTSALGEVLDPVADRLYILAVVIGLALRDVIPWWVAVSLPLRDALMWLLVPLLRTRGYSALPVHFLGKAATFNLLYAFPLLLLGDGEGVVAALAQVLGWGFAFWGIGLYWWAGGLYAWQVRRLLATTPRRDRSTRVEHRVGEVTVSDTRTPPTFGRYPDDPDLPSRVTMPLLSLIAHQALEEDYVTAGHRRQERRPGDDDAGPGRPRSRWLVVAVVAAFGLLIATAAVQTSRDAPARDASRASLISRIDQQRALVATQQDQISRLRRVGAGAEQTLTDMVQRVGAVEVEQRALQSLTGVGRVSGDGVRVSLSATPGAGTNAQIRDEDLALLVNALWSAGAEAIALNGQRLTAVTAIRASGRAVEVNEVGIAPPYTIAAIGDQATLQADFYQSSSGLAFDQLARDYAFVFDLQNVDGLTLPSAPARVEQLRSARTAPGSERDDIEEAAP